MHEELNVPVEVVAIQVLLMGLAYDGGLNAIDLETAPFLVRLVRISQRIGILVAIAAKFCIESLVAAVHAPLTLLICLTIITLSVHDSRVDHWVHKLHYTLLR